MRRPRLYLQRVGLVGGDPIADVLDAVLRQNVRSVEGLGESGPHPAARSRPCVLSYGIDGPPDDLPLVILQRQWPLNEPRGP